MNFKYTAPSSRMSYITGLSMHKITDGIKILINPVSAAEDLFHCYQLHLDTFVVSEQMYILTLGYEITYEPNR